MSALVQSMATGLLLGGIYALLAIGLDVIYGVLDLVHMSIGEFLMLAMYTTFFLYTLFGINEFILLLVVPLIFLIVSIPCYHGVFKIMIGKPHSFHILFTASLSIALQSAALVLWTSIPRRMNIPYGAEAISLGPILLNKALVIASILAVVVTLFTFIFLFKTDLGMVIRAAISNRKLISLIGIDPHKVYLLAFSLGMVLIGLGGVLLSFYYTVSPTVGLAYTMYMWVAIVLGGPGTIKGSLLGASIIGVSQTISGLYLPIAFKDVIVLVIFVIVLVFRPKGLFGK
jgi:branched-chain amino acid transport system permease protein